MHCSRALPAGRLVTREDGGNAAQAGHVDVVSNQSCENHKITRSLTSGPSQTSGRGVSRTFAYKLNELPKGSLRPRAPISLGG